MKQLFYIIGLLLAASTIFFASCGVGRGTRQSVEINGVRWATVNVETPGTFARNPESAGGFFTFDEAQNACPRGWRLPTHEELQSLVDAGSEWTTQNGVNGRLFGSGRNQLLLPAAGLRGTTGALSQVGNLGYYWSSTAWSAGNGEFLFFRSDHSSVGRYSRTTGFSVRCVSE